MIRSAGPTASAACTGVVVVVLALVAFLVASGCGEGHETGSLLERAIRARGGPLASLSRESELRVYYGFPGLWRWRYAFTGPDGYRLTLLTRGEAQHYLYDGETVRGFIGSSQVTTEPGDASCVRNHGRWLALIGLDMLADPQRFSIEELPLGSLPAGATRGVRARCLVSGATFDLGFDAELRLIAAEGPIELPGLGEGRIRARFEDFREVGGYRLPFVAHYEFHDQPFFDEHVVEFVPNDPALVGERFQDVAPLGSG